MRPTYHREWSSMSRRPNISGASPLSRSASRTLAAAPPLHRSQPLSLGSPCAPDPEPTRLWAREPLAALIGMLLDQQVTMEWASGAPLLLKRRLGVDRLEARAIAAMDPAALDAVFRDKPALHRYPGSMAKR